MPSPRSGSVIAIDHGEKRTGFAVTDALRLTIEPLPPYHGDGDGEGLLTHIANLAAERDLAALLIGIPLNADGSESGQSAKVRAFAERLATRLPEVPQHFVDEHLTSKEAEARLVEAGYVGAQRKARRDSWSALVMLEEWVQSESRS